MYHAKKNYSLKIEKKRLTENLKPIDRLTNIQMEHVKCNLIDHWSVITSF